MLTHHAHRFRDELCGRSIRRRAEMVDVVLMLIILAIPPPVDVAQFVGKYGLVFA